MTHETDVNIRVFRPFCKTEARFRRLPCVKCWRTARTQRREIAAPHKINQSYVGRVVD